MRPDHNQYARYLRGLIGVFALAMAACSTPYQWSESVGNHINDSLAQAKKTDAKAAVPADVNQALLPPMQINMPEGSAAAIEPHFDLSVNNASARQVFMGLVEGTPYSMVVSPDINGTVSLTLKDITVPQAMDALRSAYGYEYKRNGNRFFVLGRGMQTRLFPVNYLNLNRKGMSDTRVVSGELTNASSKSGGNAGSGGNSGANNNGGNGGASMQIETQSQSDFWQELQATVQTIIGTEGGRKVVINPQAGLLVVRAMPEELSTVEDFLNRTQISVNRQVVLEAKILEVTLNDGFQTGINWGGLGHAGGATLTAAQVGGGTLLSGTGVSEIAGNVGNLNPAVPSLISGTNASAFGGIFSLAVQARNFTSFIELLQTQGKVQVLSSPRVSTVNNQRAVIKVGGDEFFVTSVTNTITTVGNTPVSQPTLELTPFFSGIALDVTPQIDDNNNIILHIHPSVSEVKQENKTFSVYGQSFNLPLALSTIQESDNIVRASTGQVIVIGGLMKEGSTEENASVPLLGDIPVLGNLFKHKKVTRIKKELVILLKPTVVNLGQYWSDAVQQSQDHIDRMKNEH